MKLYHFDGIDERLELVPLSARRALDQAGLKLSLDGWKSLPHSLRAEIAEAGSRTAVDLARAREAALTALPPPAPIQPAEDPAPERVPAEIRAALGEAQPLDPAVWTSLEPLDRYALAKLCASGNKERLLAGYREIVGAAATSPHLAPRGGARMVDVAEKPVTLRRAVAESRVRLGATALERLLRADAPKGDVLGTARLAGIMAAKRTPDIVPLCHPVAITQVDVELAVVEAESLVRIVARVQAVDRTGVEMEAMHAVCAAALTIYDMLKSFDRAMEIGPARLIEKSGGRSGDFRR